MFTTMNSFMSHQTTCLSKCHITYVTAKWPLSTVNPYMSHQISPLGKCLITHTTGKMMLSTVYSVMSHQTTGLSKCLITHVTAKCILSSICTKFLFQRTLVKKIKEKILTYILIVTVSLKIGYQQLHSKRCVLHHIIIHNVQLGV